MHPISHELEDALHTLDAQTASLLERTVRDAVALARRRQASSASEVDAMGYPVGYFEATAGSFANEQLERPSDLPWEDREPW